MIEFKVGDKVRIKEREGDPFNYPFPFCNPMNKLAGTICEIKKINTTTSLTNCKSKYINGDYHIYEISPVNSSDHRDFVWAWHSSMFEPVIEKENNELYSQKPSGESKQVLTTQKTKEHEIRFQKPKASYIRGNVPTGRAICGRGNKTAIKLGHLSNKACYF